MPASLKDCDEAYAKLESSVHDLKRLLCQAHEGDIPAKQKLALAQGLSLMIQVESRLKAASAFCRECQPK